MKYSVAALAAMAPLALAMPVEKRQDLDVTVLQFALTLEHLENVFYKQALQNFTAEEFKAAGYGPNYYNNLRYIASDEESHVKFLTSALSAAGASPVAACQYNFPYTDVQSFIGLSTVLEGVGTSAYLGGAPLITNKAYLTAAGSILVTEALHTSMQRGAVKAVPAANPYGTPLDPTSVYTLAAAFIVSCPDSNAALPFTPYPALTLDTAGGFCEGPDCSPVRLSKRDAETWNQWAPSDPSKPKDCPKGKKDLAQAIQQGATVSFTAASSVPAGSFVTFISGLTVTSVAGTIDGAKISAAIPAGISGQTYVLITSAAAANNAVAEGSVLFGPAIVEVAPAPPAIDFSYYKQ